MTMPSAVILLVLSLWSTGRATHFRYMQATWVHLGNNEVRFTLKLAWRAAFIGSGSFTFGDGSSTSLRATQCTGTFGPTGCSSSTAANKQYKLDSQQADVKNEQYKVITYIFSKTYATQGPFATRFSSCCRVSSLLAGNDNNFHLDTTVDLRNRNSGSPAAPVQVILQYPIGRTTTIALNPTDPDRTPVTCRLATSAESGITTNVQNKIESLSSDCKVTVNMPSSRAPGDKWASQVVMMSGPDSVDVDFIIEAVTATALPRCSVITSVPSTGVTVKVGSTVNVQLQASVIDGMAPVTVSAISLPTGAGISPSGAVNTLPATIMLSFTPTTEGVFTASVGVIKNGVTSTCSIPFLATMLSVDPTRAPTGEPTGAPTKTPSRPPTGGPSQVPTRAPIGDGLMAGGSCGQCCCPLTPGLNPGAVCVANEAGACQAITEPFRCEWTCPSLTNNPSKSPVMSVSPTNEPTKTPSANPSKNPSKTPSAEPTKTPSSNPTDMPSKGPTKTPSADPTGQPSKFPSQEPTKSPSDTPSKTPSSNPTKTPSSTPSKTPSKTPTSEPSVSPTETPSSNPTDMPSKSPSQEPTKSPSDTPSKTPSSDPTKTPSSSPSKSPSKSPTSEPSADPSVSPTKNPSTSPSVSPSKNPTASPTEQPSSSPTFAPSIAPTFCYNNIPKFETDNVGKSGMFRVKDPCDPSHCVLISIKKIEEYNCATGRSVNNRVMSFGNSQWVFNHTLYNGNARLPVLTSTYEKVFTFEVGSSKKSKKKKSGSKGSKGSRRLLGDSSTGGKKKKSSKKKKPTARPTKRPTVETYDVTVDIDVLYFYQHTDIIPIEIEYGCCDAIDVDKNGLKFDVRISGWRFKSMDNCLRVLFNFDMKKGCKFPKKGSASSEASTSSSDASFKSDSSEGDSSKDASGNPWYKRSGSDSRSKDSSSKSKKKKNKKKRKKNRGRQVTFDSLSYLRTPDVGYFDGTEAHNRKPVHVKSMVTRQGVYAVVIGFPYFNESVYYDPVVSITPNRTAPPTRTPSVMPSQAPSKSPSNDPTWRPTSDPTSDPTRRPSEPPISSTTTTTTTTTTATSSSTSTTTTRSGSSTSAPKPPVVENRNQNQGASASSSGTSGSGKGGAGSTVGAAIGGVLGVIALCGIGYLVYRRKNARGMSSFATMARSLSFGDNVEMEEGSVDDIVT